MRLALPAAVRRTARLPWYAPEAPAETHYTLPHASAAAALARHWLLLGTAALLASGLFSLLLVAARTPAVSRLVPGLDLFRVALVVHVDLSVLVWFFAAAAMLWSLQSRAAARPWLRAAFACAATGTGLIALSPFGGGEPVMANYIPVLTGPVFLAGLLVFAAGIALAVVTVIVAPGPVGPGLDGRDTLRAGLNAAAASALVALGAFVWSAITVPAGLEARAYYELVFWGGGHVLQFTWTLLMLVAWLWLADASGLAVPLKPRVVMSLFAAALAFVFVTPVVYALHDVTSVEHRQLLTWAMRAGGGLAVGPIAIGLVLAFRNAAPATPRARALRAALAMSLVLFLAGGGIGFLIRGSTVTIPAHYHGCIVGVTLAFMGLACHLMPRLGLGEPAWRLAFWQPIVYGAGQLAHIAGLMWSGGYGVQRKTGGSAQVLGSLQELAGMALMGLGGLVAIAGGLLFLIIVAGAVRRRHREPVHE